jgi:hypothetical protein
METTTKQIKAKLKEINKTIKTGDIARVARRGNWDFSHVYRVLAGERTSAPVIKFAHRVIVQGK